VSPAGLGARDLLRLEMGYSLYGHELDDTITPLEAGLEAFVNFDKNFRGKEALSAMKEKGAARVKIAFTTNSRRSPRAHYAISANGVPIGEVTSGIFTPVTNTGIGLGLVAAEHARIGNKITAGNETVSIEAEIVELPFYRDGTVRK
jgi:aminomethyltransferase